MNSERFVARVSCGTQSAADQRPAHSARRGVLAHDEVRQWPAVTLDVADKPQRHSLAGLALDAHHFRFQMQRFLARQIEIELGRRSRIDVPGRSHEQAIA